MNRRLLSTIEERTRLAGHNRLALLLFRLGGRQRFGINVFKVQEVIRCPRIWPLPSRHPQLLGAADVRGRTLPVLDLGRAIAHPESAGVSAGCLMVTEFNRTVQGFLVAAVDRIVNIAVDDVLLPPDVGARSSQITAVTRHQNELIQIIDVEKVLADVNGSSITVSADVIATAGQHLGSSAHVLVVDDSRVARNQIYGVMQQIGVDCTLIPDGRQALRHLKDLADRGESASARYMMVISDIEMPDMDGYTLTAEIRRDPRLRDLFVTLHTSLSGVFNNSMVARVGADRFVPKYTPDQLAATVVDRIKSLGMAA